MKRVLAVLFLALVATVTAHRSHAATEVKLATVAPVGSVWDDALKRMGAEWEKATDGRVRLVIFAGGRQGDDPTILRKMRLGQLQAAALTPAGLAELDAAFHLFSAPFLFGSQAELTAVVDALEPDLEKIFAKKGLRLLAWGNTGTAHIFSKQPIRSLDELKKVRLFTSAGGGNYARWLSDSGFDAVPLSLPDVAQGLQTGIVDAVPSTPLATLSFQWYRHAPYMFEVGITPSLGAVVMNERAWKSLSSEDQKRVRDIARSTQRELAQKIPARDQAAVAEMKKRGLKVTDVDPAREDQVRAQGTELARSMRGVLVPNAIFDKALTARDAYRKQHGAAAE